MLAKCSRCGTIDSQLILDFGVIPITSLLDVQKLFSLKYERCNKCLVTCVTNSLSPDLLYGKNYNFFSSASNSYITYASKIIKKIKKITNLSNYKVLEVGCNDGALIRKIAPKVKSVVGIDPFLLGTDSFNGEIANAEVINDYFNCEAVNHYELKDEFDVVIVNNVITHVEDVFDFIEALSLVVKKNGFIYFEMCDYKKVIDYNRFDYFYHGVTNLILPDQILHFLSNFKCLSGFEFDGFDPFSCTFVLQKTNSKKDTQPQVYDHLNQAQSKLEMWRKETDNFFNNICGFKNIVGYGANSKAGSVLALSSAAVERIDVVLDINLKKNNKIISGTTVKIKHIDDYDLSKIDCIVLFASHIFDEVKHDLRDRGYMGELLVLEF
tara:strand:+ start:681 stop:1823 length:1143 start_codon:yes stop_codon:yes gene_type:complete